jgi:hypothetical protein
MRNIFYYACDVVENNTNELDSNSYYNLTLIE